ncbi:hypothetical protein EDD11_006113 [Mortierella claussenii]|nr:hypothetical protein EDD11_006113 [Mortierella claussenii]
MKISITLSLTALLAVVVAQTSVPAAKSALNANHAATALFDNTVFPVAFSSEDDNGDIHDTPRNDLAVDGEVMDAPPNNTVKDEGDDVELLHGGWSRFIAWSSPGYKGHKQERKNTRGCYRLDGGAVGSYEGSSSVKYAFYKDDRCRNKVLYGWSSAPVRRINPVIYPRSVKILDNDDDDDDDEPYPEPSKYTLVAWSRASFGGYRQLVKGMGCQWLDGSTIYSFQGEYKYKFFDGQYCYGKEVLIADGGKSSVRKINPRSVYIY